MKFVWLLICFLVLAAGLVTVRVTSQPESAAPAAASPSTAADAPKVWPAETTSPDGAPPSRVVLTIDVDPALKPLPETARVVVFIRRPGERMPLGVEQLPSDELPKQVVFEGPAEPIEAVARLSMTGRVDLQPGDVERVVGPLTPAHPAQAVSLLLSRTETTAVGEAATIHPATGHPQVGEGATIDVRVVLSDAVQVAAHTPVFVIARGPQGGPPLAVKRVTAGDLPLHLTLSRADSMVAGRGLEPGMTTQVMARVAMSGGPLAQPGDWQSAARAVTVGADTSEILLEISDRI